MSSSGYSSEIERLLQQHAQPDHGLNGDEENGLARAFVILDSNYSEMVEFVVDEYDIRQNPVHEAEHTTADVEAQQAEATRLIHNYLSALYSFNEHVRELVNRKTDGNVDMKPYHFTSVDQRRSDYSRNLTFLWGLRIDFQHGHFSGIRHELYHEYEDRVHFVQKFDENGFVDDSPLDEMERYLQYTTQNQRELPYAFVARFHNNGLDHFYDDCLDWFNQT
ncbi:hypothetical protein [Halococcus sp. IIIV-5B]|uniref:hypothetical protein n=1 Tax=Halococcus sp. IIIV-5B TaxID=2321230 RepID=UPI000E755FD9|nr:hypothetical protein [Halococcus sp. IIIV-5B]RJS96556.1 hypothetical protein D3261_19045 [Halococcus sp. IIIV-5B]